MADQLRCATAGANISIVTPTGRSTERAEQLSMKPDVEYPILVKRKAKGFELRIVELLLIVYDNELSHGLARLLEQKCRVFELAEALGIQQHLPPPLSPPRLFAPRSSKVNPAAGPTDHAIRDHN